MPTTVASISCSCNHQYDEGAALTILAVSSCVRQELPLPHHPHLPYNILMLDRLSKETPSIKEGQETRESLESIESLLHVREQYDTTLTELNKAGLIIPLPETGSYGIVGFDGKEYPMPTYKEVLHKLEGQKEKLLPKIEQGFNKILITPFALPLNTLVERYKRLIREKHSKGKLLATKRSPEDPDTKLELDTEDPVWFWDQHKDADTDGSLVYQPTSFSREHHGKTKKQLIEAGRSWDISLIEDLPNLPAEGQGKIYPERSIGALNKRKQLEANKSPNEYLKLTQTDQNYKNESGFNPEQWLTLAITHMEATNEVLDDYQGNGKLAYLFGSYFPSSGFVPSACWVRFGRRVYLSRNDPDRRYPYYGGRSSVGV